MKKQILRLSAIVSFVLVISSCTKQPEACFSVENTTASVNADVYFTDCSQDASTWEWNFGDGQTSTLSDVSHAWALPGTYTVTLTVFSQNGKKLDDATTQMTIE